MNLYRKALRRLRGFWNGISRTSRKRICARCQEPIKRSQKWSAKAWDDKKPRHFTCTFGALFPVDSVPLRITEEPLQEDSNAVG